MDALRYLSASDADNWSRLFLTEIEQYLDGAKAPDRRFRDFRNHVLHVSDGSYWGGAVAAAEQWYVRFVHCLKSEDWRRAVYCAGVLTHYVSDAFMPLHTGQTEDEGAVHRLIEWGTSNAYLDLSMTLPAARGVYSWRPPQGADSSNWLALLVIEGDTHSHQFYDTLIDHYDADRGALRAEDGMDTECRDTLAGILGRCVRALAWVFDQAFLDAAVTPPRRSLSMATLLSTLSTPLFFVTRRLSCREDRQAVERIVCEYRETGRVNLSHTDDDQTIRTLHAEEILGTTVETLTNQPVRKPGRQYLIESPEQRWQRMFGKRRTPSNTTIVTDRVMVPTMPATMSDPETAPTKAAMLRLAELSTPVPQRNETSPDLNASQKRDVACLLHPEDEVGDAPSIGPHTAARLNRIGIDTVRDLLAANPRRSARALRQRWINDKLFAEWQQQAQLVCDVPGLSGTIAQLLVGLGISNVADLALAHAASLADRVSAFAKTSPEAHIVRSGTLPNESQIGDWIVSARSMARRAA